MQDVLVVQGLTFSALNDFGECSFAKKGLAIKLCDFFLFHQFFCQSFNLYFWRLCNLIFCKSGSKAKAKWYNETKFSAQSFNVKSILATKPKRMLISTNPIQSSRTVQKKSFYMASIQVWNPNPWHSVVGVEIYFPCCLRYVGLVLCYSRRDSHKVWL